MLVIICLIGNDWTQITDGSADEVVQFSPDTKDNPQSGDFAYGMVQTLDSLGAGDNGQKVIPPVGGAKEWIIQILFMADGSLYTRARVNDNPFLPYVKRW
ncbi:TPA: hypothetical protein ACIA70_000988 [Salmonella enterica subsp. enterica serovar Java]